MNPIEISLVFLASVAAGVVNALAGGGTLITFPTLIALGYPAIAANITNTVALVPGYLGGTFAQAKDLRGQKKRLLLVLPAGVIGGLCGGLLLLHTSEKLFRDLVPFLILLASLLLAAQDTVRAWLQRRLSQEGGKPLPEAWSAVTVAGASVYGGYFGAGLGVIVLAVLGLTLEDSLTRLNATKQFISLSVNLTAAILFVFSGQVVWSLAVFMAIGALLGGALGGKLASRIQPRQLRITVVAIGIVISILYFLRG